MNAVMQKTNTTTQSKKHHTLDRTHVPIRPCNIDIFILIMVMIIHRLWTKVFQIHEFEFRQLKSS